METLPVIIFASYGFIPKLACEFVFGCLCYKSGFGLLGLNKGRQFTAFPVYMVLNPEFH